MLFIPQMFDTLSSVPSKAKPELKTLGSPQSNVQVRFKNAFPRETWLRGDGKFWGQMVVIVAEPCKCIFHATKLHIRN